MPPILRQRAWTDEELIRQGFQKYDRIRQLVMARRLSKKEAPLQIQTSWGDLLTAQAGYIICYTPGDKVHLRLSDYDHWPVEPAIFQQTYRAWKVPEWRPSPAEAHLFNLGCRPCYKAASVWAKALTDDLFIQTLENPQPVRVEAGHILAIGAKGEPYAMSRQSFKERYYDPGATIDGPPELEEEKRGLVSRLVSFLRGAGVGT